MKRRDIWDRTLKAVNHYLIFFAIASFIVTCTTMLFVTVLSKDLGIVLDGDDLTAAAKLTFLNVIILSALFTVIDAFRRKLTVARAARHIVDAAEKMIGGDFSVRITPPSRFGADESMGQIVECFNMMAEELSGVETLRADFISNVSHEMKTPLTVIHNYSTLLQSPGLSDEKRMEYAGAVKDASHRLSNMVTNILKLGRLESQQIYPQNNMFDLGENICECLLTYESVWERKNIEIQTDIAEDVMILSDKELLSLVWNNLFSNALKFTDEGGQVSVRLWQTEHHAYVSVTDTGCGISSDIGEHIFEKFYQGDDSHATEGNGLGLALVKRVIDIMRGEISVHSEIDRGTTFTVKLRR